MTNITTYLNNIKNAVFGKDVRDSIHDAIKQCYDDASTKGNANMEVTLARGKYNNLNERLDNHSSQIKEKANKNELEIERKRIDTFTKLKEGSTTGDAELMDARIGADGIIYKNLGSAIREQISKHDNISTLGYIQLDMKNLSQGSFGDGKFNNLSNRLIYKPFKVEAGDIIEIKKCNLFYNLQIIEHYDGGNTLESITGENGWLKSNQLYEIKSNGYFLILFANGNSFSSSTDITPIDCLADIRLHKFVSKEITKNNIYRDNTNDILGIKNAEFLGIYSQKSPGEDLINTKETYTTNGARLLYKIYVKKGEKINIINNEKWVKESFSNECIACDYNNKILDGKLINYTYTDINSKKQILNNYSGTYKTAKNNTYISIEVLCDCVVYVGIRYDTSSPSSWEILNDEYYSCFNVFVKNEGFKDISYTKEISWNPILSIHRGWEDAPQNTTQAFYNAFKSGYKMCECDVRETSDGHIVISHDETITGKINDETVTFTIANETLETLKSLDLSFKNYSKCKIATLEEIIELAKYFKGMYFLDMKVHNTSIYNKSMDILKRYDYLHNVYFNPNRNVSFAQILVDRDDNVNIGFAPKTVLEVENYSKFLNRRGRTLISIDIREIPDKFSVEDYQQISERGYEIGLWGVDGTTLNKCIDLHPTIIEFTDSSKSKINWMEEAKKYIIEQKLQKLGVEI